MSFAASRAVLRQSRLTLRRSALRNASTTSEAVSNTASKAKDTASNATAKASEGLSRVTSSAGSGVSRATEGITNALGRMGGRTGRLIAFVQCRCFSFVSSAACQDLADLRECLLDLQRVIP